MNKQSQSPSETIRKAAERTARTAGDEPDEQTAGGIENAKREKALTAGMRADILEENLRSAHLARIDKLQAKLDASEGRVYEAHDTIVDLTRNVSGLRVFRDTFHFLNLFFATLILAGSTMLSCAAFCENAFKWSLFGGGVALVTAAMLYQLASGFIRSIAPKS